jgi:hypothetical protein
MSWVGPPCHESKAATAHTSLVFLNHTAAAAAAAAGLCVAEVWSEVRSQATTAGYDDQLAAFLPACGIKTAGNGC